MDSNTATVQKALIADIEKNGIRHTLEWISAWYSKLAEAELKDHYSGCEPQVVHFDAATTMVREATSATNKSTSLGANALREARLQALAKLVERSPVMRELRTSRDAAVAVASVARTEVETDSKVPQ